MKTKKKKIQTPNEIFAAQLRPFVEKFGAKLCGDLCGVSARCVELWRDNKANPNNCTRVGVIQILSTYTPNEESRNNQD